MPSPFKARACITIEPTSYCEAVVEEYTNRRCPMPVRKDIRMVRPWMADIRRAAATL